ncbi:50S ribosomal protein L13 [Candidatus Microgenomates bacterium]|nr:MAG: 50S ribosomal protein L13 [Candidatus Microgenomates bacterium]
MKKATDATKISEVKRTWHLIDLKGKILGRISTDIAKLLMGKSKPYFVKNIDCGDFIVAINASEVKVTGKKELKKEYYRYSGYPGGLTIETLEKLRARKPEEVIYHAVKGMLPQNKLKDRMLTRLFVFKGEEHTYQDKFKSQKAKVKSVENTESVS